MNDERWFDPGSRRSSTTLGIVFFLGTFVASTTVGLLSWRSMMKVDPSAEVCESEPSSPPRTYGGVQSLAYRPLTPQTFTIEIGSDDASWDSLAQRFDTAADELRAMNPGIIDPEPGDVLKIRVLPKPHAPVHRSATRPELEIDETARSVGSPTDGTLQNGLQVPEDPELYVRRNPYTAWGSGHAVTKLYEAIARLRWTIDYEEPIVLADLSTREGGLLPAHRSHQSGRDVDIWLPTLQGVLEPEMIRSGAWEREPRPQEVDWFASWALVQALVATNAVEVIVLDRLAQARLYQAARVLGASDKELEAVLQWPQAPTSAAGVVVHAPGHEGRIHVRFRCADYEDQCTRTQGQDISDETL